MTSSVQYPQLDVIAVGAHPDDVEIACGGTLAKLAAEVLGAAVRVTLELPNRRLFDTFEARALLAKEFRKYRPKIVIGFGDKKPLASPDHWQAMQITDAAVFYSRLTKWDDHFDRLPVHAIQSQLYFRL